MDLSSLALVTLALVVCQATVARAGKASLTPSLPRSLPGTCLQLRARREATSLLVLLSVARGGALREVRARACF